MNLSEGPSPPASSTTPEQYASLFRNRPQMAPVYLRRAFADKSLNFPDILGGLEMMINGTSSDKLKLVAHKIPDAAITLASDKALYQSRELRTTLGFRVSLAIL